MASDPKNETNLNQVDILIQNKEDEIDELRELRKSFDDDVEIATSAEVAADPSADAAERAAAANATTGQDPAAVFAAQSEPSPSTDAEAFEQSQEAQQQAEAAEEAEDEDVPANDAGVDIPDGRGDPNKLGDPETQGFGTNPESEAANAADDGDEAAQEQQQDTSDDDSDSESDEAKDPAENE